MVFYRKYRPQKFSDLIGQLDVTLVLLGQLSSGKIGHGYLFSGPRGSGKTSTARIFAKAVNCLAFGKDPNRRNIKFGEPCNKCISCLSVLGGSHLDLIEIDAASNRLIDDVRDLREKIKLSPVSSRFKVYIIDEAHMLTREAFNALLKVLEEPPAHVIFILCTTEPAKLPSTIISRTQRFNFLRASDDELKKVIERISKEENLKIEEEATLAIAKAADGSFRDAVSFLDQLSAFKKTIKASDVKRVALFSDWNQLYDFICDLLELNLKPAVLTIERYWQDGVDLSFLAREVVLFLKKLLFIKIEIEDSQLDLDPSQYKNLRKLATKVSVFDIQNLIKLFLVAEGEMKLYPLPHIPLILAACKYCLKSENLSNEKPKVKDNPALAVNIANLEKTVSGKSAKNKLAKRTAKSSGKMLSLIQKHWEEYLTKVRSKNTHVMAIIRATKPIGYDGENLLLEVYYRFHKEKLEEPKILAMLEEILKETVGKDIKLKFFLAQKGSRLPGLLKASDVVDTGPEDFEKMAQEIFSK